MVAVSVLTKGDHYTIDEVRWQGRLWRCVHFNGTQGEFGGIIPMVQQKGSWATERHPPLKSMRGNIARQMYLML